MALAPFLERFELCLAEFQGLELGAMGGGGGGDVAAWLVCPPRCALWGARSGGVC